MSEIKKDSQEFVGYEYKEVVTNFNKISFLIDGYKNFGWEIDQNISQNIPRNTPNPQRNTVLRLKRDRKIMNKMELTRLQRNFEFCLKEINHLDKSKELKATIYAIMIGILGIVFMVGAVLALKADPPMSVLGGFLAILALVGWISPNFVYKIVERKRTEKVKPLIDEKQEEIFEICEKGNKLLYQ